VNDTVNEDEHNDFNLDIVQISSELRIRPEIYLRIVTSFSKTLQEKILILKQALQPIDLETLRRVLHEIKGTSSNLRLHNVSAAEQLMHDEVKGAGDQQKMENYLNLIKTEAERLEIFLEKLTK
jgi:HPt (histidine-containing phosphotransfer) domain-containing protein